MRAIAAPFALLVLAHASPASALDIRSSAVAGRGSPAGNPLCADPKNIELNRADRTLTLCDPSKSPSVTTLLKALPAGRRAVEQGQSDDQTVAGVPLNSVISRSGGKITLTPDAITGDGSGVTVVGSPTAPAASIARQILAIQGTTPEAQGAPASGDATAAIQAAIATGAAAFRPRDYAYGADTLDVTKIISVTPQTRLRSVMAGDSLIRDRAGRAIGLAFNHRLQQNYSGTYPRNTAATAITSGSLVAPPLSTAQPAGPVDIIAHWYGDWGLDFYRSATGIAGPTFDGWYDWRWNWTSAAGYDPARHSVLGYYRNDDPNTLDWQCYWLREAGVKAFSPVAFNLDVSTWSSITDRNLWIRRMMDAPNCRGLGYIPWARSTEFKDPDGPVTATQAQVQTQWSNLWFGLAPAYPNNYVLSYGGKRWFTVYVWNMERLRALFDPGGGSTNFAAWLKTRADEVRSVGYDGLAVLANTAVADATMSRFALFANNVLHLPSPYGGPVNSTPTSQTYAGVVAGYSPPASGQALNVSTALKLVDPLPASPNYNYLGSTPALFQTWLSKAISWAVSHKSLPQIVTVSNVSEWAEQGNGLHPTVANGWGYLDAVRAAAATVGTRGRAAKAPLSLKNGWVASATGNEAPQVWKDSDGTVRLSGVITSGTTAPGTVITTLPSGLCPAATETFSIAVSGGTSSVYVGSNCDVVALGTLNATLTGLSRIQFRAE